MAGKSQARKIPAGAGILHISDTARAALGFIADRIPVWAGPCEVLVLTTPDMVPVTSNTWWERFRAAARQVAQLQTKFPGFNLKSFLSAVNINRKKLGRDLAGENIYCQGYRNGKSAILLGRPDRDLKWFFSRSTGIPAESLKNVESLSPEFNLMVVGHECGHIGGDRIDLTSLRWLWKKSSEKIRARLCNEISADRAAFRDYFNELALGTVGNPDVPAIFRDMRAIDAMKPKASRRHATGPALYLPGEEAGPECGGLAQAGRMDKALDEVKKLIGIALGYDPAGTEFREAFSTARLPAYYGLVYTHLAKMLNRGSFDDDYYQKRYVTQYLGAIERRAPGLIPAGP